MKNQVKTITILGGGVIGWFTAAYLAKFHSNIKVTLIESPYVPILGVGESTIPQLGDLLKWLDVDERQWMKGVHGLHKFGNMFTAWNTEDPKERAIDHWNTPKHQRQFYTFNLTFRDNAFKKSFYNPMELNDYFYDNDGRYGIDNKSIDYWLELVKQGKYKWEEWGEYTSDQYNLAINNKSVYDYEDDILIGNYKSYAWHVDAERFPLIVRDLVALPLGVEWIEGHVEHIAKKEDGYIDYLQLKDGRQFRGDLFLDCTGFNRVLMKQMENEWFSMSDRLPTQSAWVAPIKYNDPHTEMRPYTQSYAQANGWNFIITLYSRMGSGYIFDERSEDKDSARERFIRYWDTHEMIRDPKLIQWDQGYYKDAWVKNVIGIGMGQGFVDPMEANSIYVAQSCIQMLGQALNKYDNRVISLHTKKAFSRHIQKLENQICDFIAYHFTISKRRDNPLWKTWGEKGLKENHIEKNWNEYRAPKNYLGRNLYLDYQWPQQHHYLDRWDDDLCKLNIDPKKLKLAEVTFNYIKQKSEALADYAPNVYDWTRDKLFDGATSDEILEQALAERK